MQMAKDMNNCMDTDVEKIELSFSLFPLPTSMVIKRLMAIDKEPERIENEYGCGFDFSYCRRGNHCRGTQSGADPIGPGRTGNDDDIGWNHCGAYDAGAADQHFI